MAQLEPFGAAAEDYRFGQLLATKYGGHPLKYFPGHDEEEAAEILKVLTMEEIKSRMQRGFKKE